MSFQKILVGSILLYLTLLGCANAQRISIPLKLNYNSQVAVSISYGPISCSTEAIIVAEKCSALTLSGYTAAKFCGALRVEEDKPIYISPFQLGDISAILQHEYSGYGSSVFCLGDSDGENDILSQLFQSGKIKVQIFYFNFYDSGKQNGQLGELDIGEPNISLIKKGTKIAELAKVQGQDTYAATSYSGLEFFGRTYISRYAVQFSWRQHYIQFSKLAFDQFFNALRNEGIEYKFDGDSEVGYGSPWVSSIARLQPLEFTLLLQDNSPFSITIQPSEYTSRDDNRDRYYFLISATPNSSEDIILGYKFLRSYYVGFKKAGHKILIAKKVQQ